MRATACLGRKKRILYNGLFVDNRMIQIIGMQKQRVLSLYGYFLCILLLYMAYLQFFRMGPFALFVMP